MWNDIAALPKMENVYKPERDESMKTSAKRNKVTLFERLFL